MQPFEGCRLRIERAKTHYTSLSDAWNEIPTEDLYAVRANVKPDGAGIIWLSRPQPFPKVFALEESVRELLFESCFTDREPNCKNSRSEFAP
jgi:hypothetical protein